MELPDYETLLERCMDALPDGVDKREGSLIHMAMAPVCLRLAEAYAALAAYYDLMFSDTAAGEYLDRLAGQYGIEREKASAAVRKALLLDGEGREVSVSAGTRFYIDGLFFVTEEDGLVRCETAGAAGSHCFGAMVPAEYLEGVVSAELAEVVIPGEDEEGDESLRLRLHERLSAPAFGGNAADYREKVLKIAGVGAVKVTPAADGGGSVKLTVLDSRYLPAEETVLETVREEVCGGGNGLGLAPIGHTVTVEAAEEVPVAVSAKIRAEGDPAAVEADVRAAAEAHLLSLREKWAEESAEVRVSALVSSFLSAKGVTDVTEVTLNGGGNLMLERGQVPVLNSEGSAFTFV